jgi:hypothetical protein
MKRAGWRSIRLFAAALWLASASFAAGNDELRVIELKHRPAQEVIPLVQPLLAPGDAMSATGYKLIVRTSEKNHRQIEQLLAQIDVGRRQWTLTVRQPMIGDRDQSQVAASGEVSVGSNARITVPGRTTSNPPGLTVETRGPDGKLKVQTVRTTTAAQNEHRQTIRALDGQRVYIRIGQSLPHVQRILALSGRTPVVLAQSVTYQDATTGFDVLPRAQGANVHLEITPRVASLVDPSIGLVNIQELSTSVTVKPGEWVDLGQLAGRGEEVRRAIAESGATRENERRTVLIKVE